MTPWQQYVLERLPVVYGVLSVVGVVGSLVSLCAILTVWMEDFDYKIKVRWVLVLAVSLLCLLVVFLLPKPVELEALWGLNPSR